MARSTPRTWRARVGVSLLFLVNGALVANVLPRLPAIKAGLDLSNAELGAAIAAMPIGGLLAGGFAGRAHPSVRERSAGRRDRRRVWRCSWCWWAWRRRGSRSPARSSSSGALDATMDAAENAHGIAVQRRYGRSILHSFHGWWSAGTMLGGAMGAVAAAAGVPVAAGPRRRRRRALDRRVRLDRSCCSPTSRRTRPEPTDQPVERIHLRNAPRLLRLLGPIALLGLLGVMLEDAAQTWSTVYLVDVLGLAGGHRGASRSCCTRAR